MAATNDGKLSEIREDIQNVNKRLDDIKRQLAYLIGMVTTFAIQGNDCNKKSIPQSFVSLNPPAVLPHERQQVLQSPQHNYNIGSHQEEKVPQEVSPNTIGSSATSLHPSNKNQK